MWSQRKAPQARVSAAESPGPLTAKALTRREPLALPSPHDVLAPRTGSKPITLANRPITLASRPITLASRPITLELEAGLLVQLEGAARARRQPPEALAGELLALALRRETQRARAEASLANLTPRQREVAELAARGYTNLRIAETLVVSPETVKTHMRHVLEKLGLRAKAQLQMLLSASPSGSGAFPPERSFSPTQSNGD